jgi:hypothetical protein
MSSAARIYIVTDKTVSTKHLVKATNQAQAVRHIAAARLDCMVANSMEVVSLMQSGAVVEDATAPATVKE